MSKYLLMCFLLAGTGLLGQQPMIPTELGRAPLTSEAAGRANTLGYGINVSTDFDDNATNPADVSKGEANLKTSILPQANLVMDRAHFSSRLFYAPGFSYSSSISAYNSSSQAAGADVTYLFTKRLSLHVLNSFSLISNPYDASYTNSNLPSFGILNRPNASAFGANVRSTTEQSETDLVYELGRHTSAGIGGTFTSLKYRTITGGMSDSGASMDSRGWSGHAFYSHQLTAKYSFGLQYTAQDFSSDNAAGQFSTLSHQVLGFATVSFGPMVHLSLFGGPQFSEIDDNFANLQVPFRSQLSRSSFAGGSSLSWQGKHSGVSASFVEQVSDSGLNGSGAAVVRTASLQLQRQIGQRWSLHFFGNYVSNNQLDPASTLLLTDSASAGIGVSKVLTPHLTLNLSAQRQQFLGSTANPIQGYQQHSYDVGTVALSYTFTRPIGR